MPAGDSSEAAQALVWFRRELHTCLFGWADALFELCDALLCAPVSIPAFSYTQSGVFVHPGSHRVGGGLVAAGV